MRPNLPILLSASNALPMPGGLLKWKKRLVKNVRLSLLLTEVMKIARLTSPFPDAPRQSSPRPRPRHGRRLALLSHPNQTRKLYTLFFALSLAHLPPFLISPNCFSTRKSAAVYAAYLRSHFSIFSQKLCVAEPEATSPSSTKPRALRSLTCLSALFSPLLNFLRLPSAFSRPLPLAQTKLPIPC